MRLRLPELCHGSKQQLTCWQRRGGGWMEADWIEWRGGAIAAPNFFHFSTFVLVDRVSPFTPVTRRRTRTVTGSKTCSAVSHSFPVSSLFPLLHHSAMNAPPNTHARTHSQSHANTVKEPCILHESSTSEGLFAFFISQLRAEMMRWKPDPALKGCFPVLLQKKKTKTEAAVYGKFVVSRAALKTSAWNSVISLFKWS